MSSLEKGDEHTKQSVSEGSIQSLNAEPTSTAVPWWKIDVQVIPLTTILYLLNFLDRANIGNARVAGLQKDLKMTAYQYNLVLTILFIPYILVELPSNLVLRRFGAHNLLPAMVILWGLVTTVQGTVTSYGGLMACRVLLGVFEGGLLPGLVLYLATFYPRKMIQTRISGFFASAALGSAFGGLIAANLLKLAGRNGRPGWAYIFIVEGGITIGFGILAYLIMPRSPEQIRGLTNSEKTALLKTLAEDGHNAEETFVAREAFAVLKQPHVWITSILGFMGGAQLYALAYFLPTILVALGYNGTKTQYMSVPPFAVAWVVSLVTGIVSDRYRYRGGVMVFSIGLSIIGYAMYLTATTTKIKYASLFFSVSSAYAAPSGAFAWVSNNSGGHYRRAVSLGTLLVFTNSGGILSTWIFTAPPYFKATRILVAFSAAEIVGIIINIFWLSHLNKRKRHVATDKYPANDDRSAAFKYTL